MIPKVRLDVVVQMKDREEEKRRRELSLAADFSRRAEQAKEAARRASLVDGRTRGDISSWHTLDLAQQRALTELRAASENVQQAQKNETAARSRHQDAWRSAEAVRKAADARRDEFVAELRRGERRENDEIAGLLYARRAL